MCVCATRTTKQTNGRSKIKMKTGRRRRRDQAWLDRVQIGIKTLDRKPVPQAQPSSGVRQ